MEFNITHFQPVLEYKGVKVDSANIAFFTKGIALVFGISSIAVAFIAEQFTTVLTASMTIFGVVGGPLLGLFTLGQIY